LRSSRASGISVAKALHEVILEKQSIAECWVAGELAVLALLVRGEQLLGKPPYRVVTLEVNSKMRYLKDSEAMGSRGVDLSVSG